ncbi:hypothetical protein TIFTF001_016595 [Ficus carica]|uniref:Uncharacterized protein n=1 Tax=Ficus carica TaxID=3494 RepID=A0AA88A7U6_FICCA|nr:hypothetical protein TIFTF001_016595 [Ficus carica]
MARPLLRALIRRRTVPENSRLMLLLRKKLTKPHPKKKKKKKKLPMSHSPCLSRFTRWRLVASLKAEQLHSSWPTIPIQASGEIQELEELDLIPEKKKREWDGKWKRLYIEELELFLMKNKLTLQKAKFILERLNL